LRALVLLTLVLVLILISSLAVYYMNRDSDNDGIPDSKEREYGTDPNKPNYLLAYALKKLPEKEALKFKNVENFNESSKEFIDLYASLSQDKRSSKEVNMILDNILQDNKIDETEKNLFDDKFVNPTLPTIDNLNWTPTRENLDKIYDINVTFIARDDRSPISYAELRFIPVEYTYMIEKYGMKPEDYPKVFPPDKERVLILTPVDGKFDSLEEKFSVPVKDIVGGREYKIVALVRDLAGNERTVEVKTPYIRQFENIAKTDDITVAAFYYNWYTEGYDIPKNLPDKPLLGLYYSDDNIVFNKHVDWATGHGIDVFVFPYPYPQPTKAFDWLERTFRKNMEADLFNQIKFSFCSTFVDNSSPQPPHDFDDPKVKREFIDNMNYIKEHYAKLPNFWRIDGKPVIVTWSTHAYQSKEGNIKDAFEKVGSNKDIYIIGEVVGTGKREFEWFSSVGGIYTYQPLLAFANSVWPHAGGKLGTYKINEILDEVLRNMEEWRNFIEKYGVDFFPTVSPGNDKTYDYRDNNRPSIILRDPSSFQKLVKTIKNSFSDEKTRVIFVCSFNEWFEGTQVEPSEGYGFTYLEILKDVLRGG